MKGLLPVFLIVSVAIAGTFLEVQPELQQQVGHQCIPNPVFNVSSFDVTPWPPVKNSSLALNITGAFSRNVFVQFFAIGTNFNRQQWHYTHTNISANYTQGQAETYIAHTYSGEQNGQYIKEVVLSNQDRNGNYIHLACWQFEYGI
jgi:hypothetical protein